MNGYRYHPPKNDPEWNRKLREVISKHKLLLIGEQIVRYKIETEHSQDPDWISAYKTTVKIRDIYNLTRVLPKSTMPFFLAVLRSVIASYETYDSMDDGIKNLIPREVFEFFRPVVTAVPGELCRNTNN